MCIRDRFWCILGAIFATEWKLVRPLSGMHWLDLYDFKYQTIGKSILVHFSLKMWHLASVCNTFTDFPQNQLTKFHPIEAISPSDFFLPLISRSRQAYFALITDQAAAARTVLANLAPRNCTSHMKGFFLYSSSNEWCDLFKKLLPVENFRESWRFPGGGSSPGNMPGWNAGYHTAIESDMPKFLCRQCAALAVQK